LAISNVQINKALTIYSEIRPELTPQIDEIVIHPAPIIRAEVEALVVEVVKADGSSYAIAMIGLDDFHCFGIFNVQVLKPLP
jgi:hypothetical protein